MTGAVDKQVCMAWEKEEDWCWVIGDFTLSLRLTERDAAKIRDFLCEINSNFIELKSIYGYYKIVKSWEDNEWKLWREDASGKTERDGNTPCEWDEASQTWRSVLISRGRPPADE